MLILFTCGLLLLSFLIHIFWWQISMPKQTSFFLLIIFFLTPLITAPLYISFVKLYLTNSPEVFSLILLYVSCALVYISLYSAIEQHSPTLNIITYINKKGHEGCQDNELIEYLNPQEEINTRLAIMVQVGWIKRYLNQYFLTKRGKQVALIFSVGALIMGIEKGG